VTGDIPPVGSVSQGSVRDASYVPSQSRRPDHAEDRHASPSRRPASHANAPQERIELDHSLVVAHTEFVLDENSDLVQVKVVDTETNRVLYEIPPKELLRLAKQLHAYQDAGHGPKWGTESAG